MSKIAQGVLLSCKRGPGAQNPKDYILRFPEVKSIGQAGRLIGRKVAWPVGKRVVRGKIVSVHGANGLVIARFKKGVPGQALGSPVEIIG